MERIFPSLRRERGGVWDSVRSGRAGPCLIVSGLVLLAVAALPGCLLPTKPRAGSAPGEMPPVYEGQSLRSIGERALTAAEDAADAGKLRESQALYQRAIWAFEYHLLLTGEEPPLLEAAREGLAEVSASGEGNPP